jgi:hypothetical protein
VDTEDRSFNEVTPTTILERRRHNVLMKLMRTFSLWFNYIQIEDVISRAIDRTDLILIQLLLNEFRKPAILKDTYEMASERGNHQILSFLVEFYPPESIEKYAERTIMQDRLDILSLFVSPQHPIKERYLSNQLLEVASRESNQIIVQYILASIQPRPIVKYPEIRKITGPVSECTYIRRYT